MTHRHPAMHSQQPSWKVFLLRQRDVRNQQESTKSPTRLHEVSMLSKESESDDVVVVCASATNERKPRVSFAWHTPSPRTLSRALVGRTGNASALATADSRAVELHHGDLARPAEKIIEGAVIDARGRTRPSGFVRLHARARAL